MKTSLLLVALVTLAFTGVARASVKPHGLFTDGAVLQQGSDVPVWGTAKDGEKVTVKFLDQEVSTVAHDGKWLVKLKPLKAGGPFTMTITGENTVEVKDLYVGEVWVCSGQSNMEFLLKKAANASNAVPAANDPWLHLCTVTNDFEAEARRDVTVHWTNCTSASAADFTAVGYFFGRDLGKDLKVPVGLISSSVGGTPAQAWTSPKTLAANPMFSQYFEGHQKSISNYFVTLANYPAEVEKAKQDGKKVPNAPVSPVNRGPGCLYNGMIAPLIPYAIRGVIWYQGESNVGNPTIYRTLFPTLIKDWRDAWGEGEFPFLFVQIAPFHGNSPELREAQLLTWQTTPKTAMAVITDYGDATNIHPPKKEPVGERLALAARAVAYGEKIEYSGPVYESMKVDGDRAILTFTHIGRGLEARGGELKGFTIGTGTNFLKATAEIDDDKVIVQSVFGSKVPMVPTAVRYGWDSVPDVNLYNKEGLPATPFRTDAPGDK